MQPGQWLLRLGWLGTYVQTQHDDSADVVGQGSIPIIHDQDIAITEARLALDVGLTERFAASLVLPIRVVSTSIVYRDGADMPVQLVEPNIHHRNETLTGFADPMVLGAYSRVLGGVRWTARAGTSIPLGRTEDDPFVLGEMGDVHQHIQMGTGTFNPVLALEASRAFDKWRFGGFGFTQQVIYENGKGFHAGDRYAAGLSLRRALGKVWSVRGGPEFQAETAERWNGIKYTEEGNQGRIDVMLGAGVAWAPMPNLSFDFMLKIPVYTHVVGGQLDVPAIAELGASWSFGGPKPRKDDHEHGEEHAHEHEGEHGHEHEGEHAEEGEHGHEHAEEGEHGHDEHAQGDEHARAQAQTEEHALTSAPADEHATSTTEPATTPTPTPTPRRPPPKSKPAPKPLDTAGADVADLGRGGERVDLRPVPGKLTIFDFWAEWCKPCKELEPALVEMARGNPNVAIRRVEVIDWDSPVVAQHLTRGGFDLPHLKVYDAKGNLVLEQSSAPGKLGALIEAVRALVPAKPAAKPPVAVKPPVVVKPLVIDIAVTQRGFEPKHVKVPRKRPVVLRYRRSFEKTCATEVVFDHDGKHVVRDLPFDKTVDVAVTFDQPGTITYACAMNMIRGTITVQ